MSAKRELEQAKQGPTPTPEKKQTNDFEKVYSHGKIKTFLTKPQPGYDPKSKVQSCCRFCLLMFVFFFVFFAKQYHLQNSGRSFQT